MAACFPGAPRPGPKSRPRSAMGSFGFVLGSFNVGELTACQLLTANHGSFCKFCFAAPRRSRRPPFRYTRWRVPNAKSRYGVHPGVAMTQKWIAELKGKTGRSLDEWLALIRQSGPADLKDRRAWLKSEHGLGTNYAAFLAERAEGKGRGADLDSPEAYLAAAARYVSEMFAGPKA